MSYDLFVAGIGLCVLALAGLVFFWANRFGGQPVGRSHILWPIAFMVAGMALAITGQFFADTYYLDQAIALGFLALLVVCLAATTERGADVVKSTAFAVLLFLSFLLLSGPPLLDRLTEIGTTGVKFALPEQAAYRTAYSGPEKEKSFKPRRLLGRIQAKAIERAILQDAAVHRTDGYRLSAFLISHAGGVLPSDAEGRKMWAENLYKRAVQGQVGADVETTKRHVEAWTRVWDYEEFAKICTGKIGRLLEQAIDEEKRGQRARAQGFGRGVLELLEKGEARRFAETVYYHSFLTTYLRLLTGDIDGAFSAAYHGAAKFPAHINSNETVRTLLWTENNDSSTAKRYMERALEGEENVLMRIKDNWDVALTRLGATATSANVTSKVIEAEIAEVQNHRKTYEERLSKRFRDAAIDAKNDIAYFAAMEVVDSDKAKKYAGDAVEAFPREAAYLDTLGFVKLRFAEPGDKGRDEVVEALRLFDQARSFAAREKDAETRAALLKVIDLHRKEAVSRRGPAKNEAKQRETK
jgi:hypothetical protein